MSKLERLLNLIAALNKTSRPITRDEIKEKLPSGTYSDNKESFRRTFERDKEELKNIGIPVVFDEVTQGYFVKSNELKESGSYLEPDELAALHIAFNLVRIESTGQEDPFWKLGPSSETRNDIQPLTEIPLDPSLNTALTATAEKRMVGFVYKGEKRELNPLRAVFKRGRWYLVGYDLDKKGIRNFRVDRIEGKVELGEINSVESLNEEDLELNVFPWRYGEENNFKVTMRVEALHAPWIVTYLGENSVKEENADGSVIIEEEVNDWKSFRSFALTFLDGVKILSPQESKEDMQAWLRSFL